MSDNTHDESEQVRTPPIRVAIVDDHALVRDGFVAGLQDEGFVIVHAGASPDALLAQSPDVDVVLLDLDLGDGREATVQDAQAMMERGWRVLIVSAMGRPERVRDFLRSNVSGFVPKWESHESLVSAIRGAAEGAAMTSRELAGIMATDDDPQRPTLSDQERRALQLYASGLKMTAVARKMNVSPYTAKEYIARVRAKYAAAGRPARTKTELYREAVRDHLLDE